MRFNAFFLLLTLSCLCLALAQVSYDNCCLKYVKKMEKTIQKHAVKYREQVLDGGCNIPAVIFTLKRGRLFCTDPKDDWVQKLKAKLDKQGQRRHINISSKKPRKHSSRG